MTGGRSREARRRSSGERPRVIIADPDAGTRRRVRDAFQDGPGFIVPAEAVDGREALELIRFYQPDLVVADGAQPQLDGFELLRSLEQSGPPVPVLVHSLIEDVDTQIDLVEAGADGFVSKGDGVGDLVAAVRTVLEGEVVLSPAMATRVIERLRTAPRDGAGMRPIRSILTAREWEIVDLLERGFDTKAIAGRLVLSEQTVYTHIKHVLRKLGVHSRAEAVEAAKRMRRSLPESDGSDGAGGRA